MCGILALLHADVESEDVAEELHDALYTLQHRGQDACGIAVCGSGGKFYQCKGNGIASKVFNDGQRVLDLSGYMGIGHLRYPTAGSSSNSEAQPFYVNSPYGICFAHNGNLVNAVELKRHLDEDAHRHLNTASDSEAMLNIFANELNETKKKRVNEDDIFAALTRMYDRCVGAWACTGMLAGFGIMGFRDSYGIRPLVIGSRDSNLPGKKDWMMASESAALTLRGFKMSDIQNVLPGQAVIIPKDTAQPVFRQVQPPKNYAPDVFEFVYFARPDAIIDGIRVSESRERMGSKLATNIRKQLSKAELDAIDVVIPIPETATPAARFVAQDLGIPFSEGFVKNRYVFRTFIMPGQRMREKSVRRKLSPMGVEFKDKVVLLVDDSIVRGTTSREIVSIVRECGARRIYFGSCAPRITDPHIYGIDLASKAELIGGHRNEEDIAKHIGAEKVFYQTLEDLKAACAECESHVAPGLGPTDFEVGVFCGTYVTPVDNDYFEHLERIRGESKRLKLMERARQAVAAGSAGRKELDMATNGVVVDQTGAVVPTSQVTQEGQTTNGEHSSNKRKKEDEEDRKRRSPPRREMDMSLHNIGDFEPEGR